MVVRRLLLFRTLLGAVALAVAGCGGASEEPELVWGRRGTQAGDFVRPRAIAIDSKDQLYIVDFTARIQVYDRDGHYLNGWSTPDFRKGRPSGLSIDRDGNLIVSDSHYNCFRIYSADGVELRRVDGPLAYVSDVVQDAEGFYYVAEFGENQRISKLDSSGKPICSWGSAGTEPGQFQRARALALGSDGLLYVADACNHRIQVFTRGGELVRSWGKAGEAPGELSYPYDLAFAADGTLYVVEFGNHRVQKFTVRGEPLGCWGGPGREPGRLHNPWALAIDSKGRVHIVDTENHRIQRISF
jgi:DNA-binding beta-propeller fold protein YncE